MAEEKEYIKNTFKSFAKKNLGIEPSAFEYGKLPPQALDVERAVLGALLIDSNAFDTIQDFISPDTFYSDSHKLIYKSMMTLSAVPKPIDLLTVSEQLRKDGNLDHVGGAFFISELTNAIATSANIEYHARIIAQKYLQRELINISSRTIKDSYEDTTDVFELLDKTESNLFQLSQYSKKKSTVQINTLIDSQIKEIQKRIDDVKSGKTLTGIGSGFTALDRYTSGWQNSDLIIIAGRPAMGKTAFTLALARNAAIDFEKPVAFFSLEMSAPQLVQRIISMETEVSGDKLRRGDLRADEWTQVVTKIGKLETAPLFIDDTPALSIFELRAKARRLKRKNNIGMIVIDYLQLMTGTTPDGKSNGNREQEISSISRSLKSLAKELNIPIIALSQLSRSTETRTGTKKPQLSDLRESGAIEQDADMVMFLYRPEYYGIETDEDQNNTKGIAEVIIAKHRNGSVGTVKTRFINELAKFIDIDNSGNYSGSDFPTFNNPIAENRSFIQASSKMNNEEIDIDSPPF